MNYEIRNILDGASSFINSNRVYDVMNDLQEVIAKVAIKRIYAKEDFFREYLKSNKLLKMLDVVDENGKIDADSLAEDLKTEIDQKGKIRIDVPVIGVLTFRPSDIDSLMERIRGGAIE